MENFLDYGRFVKIKEEFDTLTTIEEKINLWSREELQDFIYMIDYDKKEVSIYGCMPNNIPSNNLLILSCRNMDEHLEVVKYAQSIDNSPNKLNFDEMKGNYWKRIQESSIAEDFLKKELNYYSDSFGVYVRLERDYEHHLRQCYLDGFNDSIEGKGLNIQNAIRYLIQFKVKDYLPIKEMSVGIKTYTFGFHNAQYKGFLLEQQRRLNKGEDIQYPANTDTSKPMQELPISPKKWQGNKNDLAELIYALDKSERIRDPNTGQRVTQKDLVKMFEFMFGVELNSFSDLVTKKLKTFESRDGKTFINELKGIIDERIK